MARLTTRTIRDQSELVAFFNQLAVAHAEAHGDADRLLQYRLGLILRWCEGRLGVLLELSPNFGDGLKDQAAAWA